MSEYETYSLVFTVIQTLLIVVSLVAVWHQLKQFNLNMQHEAYSKHIEDYSRITELLIEKPELNTHFFANTPEFLNLSPSERDFYNYLALAVGFLERLYMLYRKGWTDHDTWNAWDRWFAEQWFTLPMFKVFWEREGKYFITEFYQHVNTKYQTQLTKRCANGSATAA